MENMSLSETPQATLDRAITELICRYNHVAPATEQTSRPENRDPAESLSGPSSEGGDTSSAHPDESRQSVWARLKKVKQTLGRALISTYYGYQLYVGVKGLVQSASSKEMESTLSKEQFDILSRQSLTDFIASDAILSMPALSRVPDTSIVVVTFNQAHLTLQFLRSLLSQDECSFELIIVDNCSSDQTGNLLDRIENVKVARNLTNEGFIKAANQGAGLASSDRLLFLNNDAIVLPGCIENACSVLNQDSSVGAVGGRIIHFDGRLQEAGSEVLPDGSCRGIGRGDSPNDPRYMFRRKVDFCSGAFLLTRRSLWEEIGGFDERYCPAYYEDVDYCIELKKRGFDVIYDPFSSLLHYEFGSSESSDSALTLQRKNRVAFVDKHKKETLERSSVANLSALDNSSLLFIDDRVPHPSLGAGYPRSNALLKELHALGFSITVYPMIENTDTWSDAYALLPRDVELILPGGKIGLAGFLKGRKRCYDAALVSREHNFRFSSKCLLKSGIWKRARTLIYDAEAIVSERDALWHEVLAGPVPGKGEVKAINRELRLAKKATTVVSVCDRDAEMFRDAGHQNVHVVGHSLTVDMSKADFAARSGFLFVGALRGSESPNVDALMWFCSDVLPRLRDRIGVEVPVYVVGDATAPVLSSIDDPFVLFMGRVGSIKSLYERCRVFIAPTRYAAGIPHKVHEASAMGLPSVISDVLLSQLGWSHDREVLSAKTAEDFAAHCESLYTDEARWSMVRERAVKAVEEECDPEAFSEAVKAMISSSAPSTVKSSDSHVENFAGR